MIYIWLAVFILSIIVEASTMGLFVIWFAIGALAALACELFGLHIAIQVATFAVVSLFLFFAYVKKVKMRCLKTEKTNLNAIIGSVCVVEETIPENGKGRIIVNSQSWSAKEQNGKKIEKGATVEVLSIQGVTLLCKKKEGKEKENV